MIHGVDSMEHLQEVERAAAKVGRQVDVLLQVHVAREETKFGFAPEELQQLDATVFGLEHVRVCGVMGMASNTDDQRRVRDDFRAIRSLFDGLKAGLFAGSTKHIMLLRRFVLFFLINSKNTKDGKKERFDEIIG